MPGLIIHEIYGPLKDAYGTVIFDNGFHYTRLNFFHTYIQVIHMQHDTCAQFTHQLNSMHMQETLHASF